MVKVGRENVRGGIVSGGNDVVPFQATKNVDFSIDQSYKKPTIAYIKSSNFQASMTVESSFRMVEP